VQQHHWFAHPKAAWVDAPESGANQIAQSLVRKDVGWRIGESVAHAKFGEGVIVNIEGSGGNARAHINFGRHGMKLLDLSVAKLAKVAG
jgi:DNA helicase-2/ATP-dependent DNA helicase PcrA